MEQQRHYIERSGKKAKSPAEQLAEDLPARIAAALACERKAAMPPAALFHAAFTRAREDGLVEQAGGSSTAEDDGSPIAALATGFVLPPANFEKSGRSIPRAYWDAVRNYPLHCPLDLPVSDDSTFVWEDDPMPRFGSYDLMTARDPAFAIWAKEAQQLFPNLSIHLQIWRDVTRVPDEETWQWASRAYAMVIRQTGADIPEHDLSQLVGQDYDIVLDDERGQVWWRWAERHWAIRGYLSQQHGYRATDDLFDDNLVNGWLCLLVGQHTTGQWLQPAWLRSRLFDWRALPLFAAPVPGVQYPVPKTVLVLDE